MNENHMSLEKLNQIISRSWDANVRVRAEDLEKGTDYSYTNIILPWVLDRVLHHTTHESRILDIGCGCGYLTYAVYDCGRRNIKGIDLSAASIAYAQEKYPAIRFVCQDICSFSADRQYDLCLAVMTLNNIPVAEDFFASAQQLLRPGGRAVIVIPHPSFWPVKHLKQVEYHYLRERPYEITFSTKGRTDYASNILYFHRPLETYLQEIKEAGFYLTAFRELAETSNDSDPDIIGLEIAKPEVP